MRTTADSRRHEPEATMMIEYDDPVARKAALAKLKGVEDRVYVQVDGQPRVYAIADEDLERETTRRHRRSTSCARVRPGRDCRPEAGAAIAMGVDHPNCNLRIDEVAPQVQAALVQDFR